MPNENDKPWFTTNEQWQKRIEEGLAEGVPVFQKNGLPIVCQRGHDGALLEHEHADHEDYKFPVEVEFIGKKVDEFERKHIDPAVKPEHKKHNVDWMDDPRGAYCKDCQRALSVAEIYYEREYMMAGMENSAHEPHTEALIYSDNSVALTLYECCYTLWTRRSGDYLHGPTWSKSWRLTEAARAKIWPPKEKSE